MSNAVRCLNEKEKDQTRELWTEVFSEDTESFLDYYYDIVIKQNQIFGQREEGRWVSMLHLNPYEMNIGEKTEKLHYIVAVATQKDFRHQGRMRDVLTAALGQMYKWKESFTYLMPASEAIYTGFGFRTVYRQSVLAYGTEKKSIWNCRVCTRKDLPKLVEFSQEILSANTMIYTKRSLSYYEKVEKELHSMNGEILLFYNEEQMMGYCFTGNEGTPEIWEIVTRGQQGDEAAAALTRYFASSHQLPIKIMGFLPGDPLKKIPEKEISYRPMIMIRIVHLESCMRYLKASETFEVKMKVTDDQIRENEGFYLLQFSKEGCIAKKTESLDEAAEVTIADLCECIFGIRKIDALGCNKWKTLDPVYINELV